MGRILLLRGSRFGGLFRSLLLFLRRRSGFWRRGGLGFALHFAVATAAALHFTTAARAAAALLFTTAALGFAAAALLFATAARATTALAAGLAALVAAVQQAAETNTAAAMAMAEVQVEAAAATAAAAFNFAATTAAAATAEEGESVARNGQHGHDQSNPGKVHSKISIRVRLPAVTSPARRTPIIG